MKRLFLILVPVMFLACGKQQEPVVEQPLPFVFDENLQQIDSLMQTDAGSALMMLINLSNEDDTLSFRAQRGTTSTFNTNYQSLLISEALYKTYNPQLNRYRNETFQETSLHEAVQYFDSLYINYPKNDDLALLSARSHYMNGVGYYENDSVVDACREYFKTLEIMENHFEEKDMVGNKAKFIGLTCTRLGELFYNNYNAKISLHFYKSALKYYAVVNNYSLAYPYRNVGSAYYLDHQPDSALFYYRKARHYAKNQNKITAYCVSLSESAPIHYDLGYIDSAFIMIKAALQLPCSDDFRLAQYYTLGFLYAKENRYDSAIIYLEQSIERNSYATQTSSSELLMNCYQALGDTIKASYYKGIYGNNFSKYRNNAELTTELTKLYDDYQQQRIDNDNLLKRRHQYRIYYIVFSAVLLLIVSIIVIFRIKVQNAIDKSHNDLAIKEKALADLKRKMEANPFMNEPICKSILEIANKERFKSKVPCVTYKEYALSKEQLLALKEAIDRHCDSFTQWICKEYPRLTIEDVDYLCLYYLGLKDTDISALMQREYPTIGERSRKLKRIFNSDEQLSITIQKIINAHKS